MDTNSSETVGGIILAAGESSRFGTENKLLASVDGDSLIGRVAGTAVESSLDDVVAVLGHDANAVAEAIDPVDVSIVHNPRYSEGQSSSVRRGVEFALESEWDAVVVLLADMPFVDATTVDRLVDAYRSGMGSIIAPHHSGQRGNPVLFGRQHFERLRSVSGDRGGREFLRSHPGLGLVDVPDSGILRDIDVPAELNHSDI